MLLLVLIFVLAAFGLLLAALWTGSAAWAWASVAVSVAAAGALVFDWVQRRAAVSDGSRAGSPMRTAAMVDPPTTALPPVGAPVGARPEPATQVFGPMGGPGAERDAPGAPGPQPLDHQFAAAPPGSAGQPPSAAPGLEQPSGDRSQSVTASGFWRSSEGAQSGVTPPDEARSGAENAAAAGQAGSDSAAVGQRPPGQPPVSAVDGPPSKPRDKSMAWQSALSGADPVMAKAPKETSPSGAPAAAKTDRPDQEGEVKADDAAKPADHPKAPASAGASGGQPADKLAAGPASVTDGDQVTAKSSQLSDDPPTTVSRVDQVGSAAANPLFTAAPSGATPAQSPATSGAGAAMPGSPAEQAAPGAPAKSDAAKSDAAPGQPATQQAPPAAAAAVTQAISSAIRPAPEPGEERTEPAAAAIVAKLNDEVLVVDEQPRYHLAGCRMLVGRETIPLAAKDAVEYEFTPCQACSPVWVLAARNRAASKS